MKKHQLENVIRKNFRSNSCLVSVDSLRMSMQKHVTYLTKALLCFVLIIKYFRNRLLGKIDSNIKITRLL